MKDFLKNELAVGDKVVAVRLGYREFIIAEIISITPQLLWLKSEYKDKFKQPPSQVIKIK